MNNLYTLIKRGSKRFGSRKIVFVSALLLSGAIIAGPHAEKVPNVPPGAFNQGLPDQAPLPQWHPGADTVDQ